MTSFHPHPPALTSDYLALLFVFSPNILIAYLSPLKVFVCYLEFSASQTVICMGIPGDSYENANLFSADLWKSLRFCISPRLLSDAHLLVHGSHFEL